MLLFYNRFTKKAPKTVQRSYIPQDPGSLTVNILYYCDPFVTTKEPTVIHYCQLNSILYSFVFP